MSDVLVFWMNHFSMPVTSDLHAQSWHENWRRNWRKGREKARARRRERKQERDAR